MNIYWITKINKNRFYSTSRFELAKALRERGHKVTLIIERNIGEKPALSENEISVPTVPSRIISRFLFGLLIFLYLPFKIRKEKIDVIMIDGANIWSPFALSLKFFHIPLILDIRTLSTDKEKSLETMYYDTSLVLSRFFVDGLTTITPELKEVLSEKYHINQEQIGVWTTGVSNELLDKPVNPLKKINATADQDSLSLMYHGTYEMTRGIESLIESLADLGEPLKKKIRLTIVGLDEIKRKDISELINSFGLQKQVMLVPPVNHNDIYSYLDTCDVGVIPLSPQYIWWRVSAPLKTLEYLSRGKPILTTNIPFHQRIFDKAKCGLLIPSSERKILTEAITKIYLEKKFLPEMGAAGRDVVRKYFTWGQSALDLELFINKIITDERR
jgi:glycosyltransferase involved in cell wall biosynthesis